MNRFSMSKGELVPPFTSSNNPVICRRRDLCTQVSKQALSISGLFKQASKHRAPYQASKRVDLKYDASLLVDTTVQDTRCWWCSSSRQDVAYLMLKCRKWRRQRMEMLDKLETSKIWISARKGERDFIMLFEGIATESVLHLIEHTAVGKRRDVENTRELDEWDSGLLGRED